ncbi:MAG: hypothetical protein ACRDPA_16465, partial [Solirubrobacteraceae bacterium]
MRILVAVFIVAALGSAVTASAPAGGVGTPAFIVSTPGSSSFTVPAGVTVVTVRVVGAGGG